MSIFEPYQLANHTLKNRIVMAPLTRCRAINGNLPNELMAVYYGQRAGAGLIIAEGTSPSPNGLGYTNIPGCFNNIQAEAWKNTTTAVHKNGGKIFLQLMHTGRVAHPNNLPDGAQVVGASAIKQENEISTYDLGKQPYPIPRALSTNEVYDTISEFKNSAKLAIDAGFDGIEIHCAHGYLPNQFISNETNIREDEFGGSIENRCKFVLEIAKQIIDKIGKDKTGIRISPFSWFEKSMGDELIQQTYTYLFSALNDLDLAYIHLSFMGEEKEKIYGIWDEARKLFKGTIIQAGDFTFESAVKTLDKNEADLIAFGRDYIANPDLVERFKNDWPLAERNKNGWYGNDAIGYTDYPTFDKL